MQAQCPECDEAIELPTGTLQGEIVACGACLAELEVIGVDPLALALAPEIEEDWGE
ncbi:MAG TPA: lysine biosynthesis protein LysW [Candidatus Dormibacteraeota bacterium]|nr:lysine biosynthesis protein LysW [Candidatus Dormibacteraeota bacterium]